MPDLAPKSAIWLQTGLLLLLGFLAIFFNEGLWVSSDTLNYISITRSLLDGKLYYNYDQLSAVWPLGYPSIIALFYSLSGSISVALIAVHVLLLASFGVLTGLLAYRLGLRPGLFPALMLFSLLFTVLLSAWSELLFINLMLGLILVMNGNSRLRLLWMFLLLAAMIETRYIGLFMVPVIAVFEFWQKGFSIQKTAPVLLVLLAAPLVFLFHQLIAGSMTGSGRGPNQDSILKILSYAATSFHSARFYFRLATTALLTVSTGIFIYVLSKKGLFSSWKNKLLHTPDGKTHLTGLLLFAAMAYIGLLVALRFRTHFDMINFRLMAPATVLVSMLILWLFEYAPKWGKLIFAAYFLLAIGSQFYGQIFSSNQQRVTSTAFFEPSAPNQLELVSQNAKLLYALTGVRVTQDPKADQSGWNVYNGGIDDPTAIYRSNFLMRRGKELSLSAFESFQTE